MQITFDIPNSILPEVIEAVAETWENDARALDADYDELSDADKLATLFMAEAKRRTSNKRRATAERTARENVPPVPIVRRTR